MNFIFDASPLNKNLHFLDCIPLTTNPFSFCKDLDPHQFFFRNHYSHRHPTHIMPIQMTMEPKDKKSDTKIKSHFHQKIVLNINIQTPGLSPTRRMTIQEFALITAVSLRTVEVFREAACTSGTYGVEKLFPFPTTQNSFP